MSIKKAFEKFLVSMFSATLIITLVSGCGIKNSSSQNAGLSGKEQASTEIKKYRVDFTDITLSFEQNMPACSAKGDNLYFSDFDISNQLSVIYKHDPKSNETSELYRIENDITEAISINGICAREDGGFSFVGNRYSENTGNEYYYLEYS